MARRLAIISTHPIQYYSPLFRLLAQSGELEVRVFYGWDGGSHAAFDPGFGQVVQWDVPLLDGYDYVFVPNESRAPGTHHYQGIKSKQFLPTVKEWKPDAMLVFGWNYHSHLTAMRAFHGKVPIYFRGDSTLVNRSRGLRGVARRHFLRWVYTHVDTAFYVGVRNREYFLEHGLNENQLVWAPHAVDNARFASDDPERNRAAKAWRERLGIPTDALTVLFAGKFEIRKAPEVLLDAFLNRNHPEDHLILAGTGGLGDVLKARAGDHQNVHFIGFQNQSQMPLVYRLGDVFALPSRDESWGLAINEAMACSRPVIASDAVGCAADLVLSHHTGEVFASEQRSSLRSALDLLLSDRDALLRMGKNAAQLIEKWSIEELARIVVSTITGRPTEPRSPFLDAGR